MNIRIRFSAGCAVFALVVSLLSAIVAGVPFAMAVMRALISAVVFAGLGVALQLAVSRYLPELEELFLAGGAGSDASDEPGEARQTVDIVVDDDDDIARPDFDQGIDSSEDADDGLLAVEDEDDDGRDSDAEPESADDLVVEAEELEADDVRRATVSGPDPADDIDVNGLDQLPDVGGYSGAFESSDRVSLGDEDDGSTRSGVQDPALVARALQTMLKRDE